MIGDVWNSLRAEKGSGPGIVRRRVMPDALIGIYAAMRKPHGTPMLLLDVPTEALPGRFSIPEVAGFATRLHPEVPGPHGRVLVELELLEPNGQPVFMALVDDVLLRVGAASDAKRAASELSSCLARWSAFFRTRGVDGLSPSQQQGLYGELVCLRDVVAHATSSAEAVSAWTGPLGSNQDFEMYGRALEVKTTASNPLTSIRVSNLRQLDDSCLASLHLIVVEVERHENATDTLPDLVHNVTELVLAQAPHMAMDLAQKLTECGYLEQHSGLYSSTGYGIRAVRAFGIADGFPRITESDVRVGVGDVKYAVSLAAIGEYELELLDLMAQMKGWLGEQLGD